MEGRTEASSPSSPTPKYAQLTPPSYSHTRSPFITTPPTSNVGCTPAPFTSPAYEYAREYSKIFAELFKPQTTAFSEIWLGDEKAASVEYWKGGGLQECEGRREGGDGIFA